LENLIDWWQDMEPLLKIAVPHLIDKLDDLEQKGIFRVNSAILGMYAKLAAAYTPEDVEVIGDGFVRMHGIVKKFADPVVIQSIEAIVDMYAKLASVYQPEDIESIGDGFVRMHGMVKKFADPKVIDLLDRLTDVPAQVKLEEARPGPLRDDVPDDGRRLSKAWGWPGIDQGPGQNQIRQRSRPTGDKNS
jgi:hypothetical protein